jgi:AraC family transcriptional regulator
VPATTLTPAKVHHRITLPGCVVSEFSQFSSKIPKHYHKPAILSVVVNGNAREQLGARHHEFSPNSIVFKPAEEVHTHEYGAKGTRVVAIEIDPRVAAEWLGSNAERVILCNRGVGESALARIRSELCAPDDLSQIAIQSALLELLTVFIRGSRRLSHQQNVAQRVREYIHCSVLPSSSISKLASESGVTLRLLESSFRREYGCSVAEYIREHRFNRALELITTTETPLACIAHDLGYCDQAHMSRDVSQRTGNTPTLVRQRARKNTNR